MLPTEDLFVYVYVLVDDAIGSRAIAIAPRPASGAGVHRRRAAGHRAGDVLQARPPPRDPLCDKGFTGVSFAAAQAARARGARPARPEPAHGHAASC